ncbi:MAG: N-acetylmuramoyl-L-alanine amidase [Acidimicrobiia bacterium]
MTLRRLLLQWALGAVIAVGLVVAGLWYLEEREGGIEASATTTAPPAATTTTSTTTTSSTTTTIPIVPVGSPTEPDPEPPAPPPGIDPDFAGTGVVTIAAGGADLSTEIGGVPFARAREGLVFAGQSMSADGEWIEVFTTCDETAWVRAGEVAATAPAPGAAIGAGFDFGQAVVVVDPGHGGPNNIGAVGPDDLLEKEVNLDIARRLRDLLAAPRVVDWDTGEIFTGSDIPAAARVILTRVGEGEAGDYEAGIHFRAALANAANATVLVSIHNNAGWEITLDTAGSDVFYQSQNPESRRLARIMVEEFRRGFDEFAADWVGAVVVGAKSRLSPGDGASQYYGVLRRTQPPAVIAEGAYIANPTEAALLRTPEFREAYAAAVYRSLVRFLTSDDNGDGPSFDPEVWHGDAGGGAATTTCHIPAQGETPGQ